MQKLDRNGICIQKPTVYYSTDNSSKEQGTIIFEVERYYQCWAFRSVCIFIIAFNLDQTNVRIQFLFVVESASG